jgi:hypothetical protein
MPGNIPSPILFGSFGPHGAHQLSLGGNAAVHFRLNGVFPDADSLPQNRGLEDQLVTRLHRLFEASAINSHKVIE